MTGEGFRRRRRMDMKQNVLKWNAYWLSQHVAGQALKTQKKTPGNKKRYIQHTGST